MFILGWAGLVDDRKASPPSAETLLPGGSARGAPVLEESSGGRSASLALPLYGNRKNNHGIS